MKLRTITLAALALALALPAAANGRRGAQLPADPTLEAMRAEILLQAELARPILGDQAVELLRERAGFARRIADLELVAEDGILVTEDVLNTGRDATELLLRSPSAILLRDDRPRVNGHKGRVTWTRGSWMDSPDEAT